MSGASITAEPPSGGSAARSPGAARGGATRSPSASSRRPCSSSIWIVYPTIRTTIRSFFDRSGDEFVWFDNYQEIFTSDVLLTAVKNNAIWVSSFRRW